MSSFAGHTMTRICWNASRVVAYTLASFVRDEKGLRSGLQRHDECVGTRLDGAVVGMDGCERGRRTET